MKVHEQHHDIFLSHSGKQKGVVKDLEIRLSSMGYDVFFDQKDDSLPPGQHFPHLIFAATKTCKFAIVVLSDDFFISRWPMIELYAFAERQPNSHSQVHDSSPSFTLLPLFLKLSPEDLKKKAKVDEWRKVWEKFEVEDHSGRFKAEKCEEAMRLLSPLKGIIRLPESEQGDAAYINKIAHKISKILPLREKFTVSDLRKQLSCRDRLCNIILGEFRKLEVMDPSASNYTSTDACILGIHGVPGSGKSTLCRFLCDSMYEEFHGNVIYLELPTKLDPHHVCADTLLLATRYADLLCRLTRSNMKPSTDLNKLYRFPLLHLHKTNKL